MSPEGETEGTSHRDRQKDKPRKTLKTGMERQKREAEKEMGRDRKKETETGRDRVTEKVRHGLRETNRETKRQTPEGNSRQISRD